MQRPDILTSPRRQAEQLITGQRRNPFTEHRSLIPGVSDATLVIATPIALLMGLVWAAKRRG